MNKKQKKRLIFIITAAIFYIAGVMTEHIITVSDDKISDILFVMAFASAGYDVLIKAIRNISKGKVFDENFLMGIASLGAIAIGEFPEAGAVMIFYQVGELFQSIAIDKSRKSISDLMDIRPDYANLRDKDTIKKVDPYDVKVDDIIIVKPGERVPLDGIVEDGESFLDTSALTGESVPSSIKKGDMVTSGCINKAGLLTIKVSKEYGESTVSKILDLVENASARKSVSENFITKFAAIYTPIVVFAAIAVALIPTIICGLDTLSIWAYRALAFLVVSCPCALVISVPLSFFGGIGSASKQGILVKGSNYLEALAHTKIVAFDKTGTLTKGIFEISDIKLSSKIDIDKDKLIEYAAYAESNSSHPIAISIIKSYDKDIDASRLSQVNEIAGHGLSATVDGKNILIGNGKLLDKEHISHDTCDEAGTVVYVAIDGIYAGYILISDKIKDDVDIAISSLRKEGVSRCVMLTGDRKATAEHVARIIGVDEVYAELLPAEKVEKVDELENSISDKEKLIFVGDGINDAPVLARADIGVAMGGLGSDAAIEAADVVIMTDEPSRLINAICTAKRTLSIANQNIIFALTVKILILILAALGLANMWAAVFGDIGVAIIAILNSMRMITYKVYK